MLAYTYTVLLVRFCMSITLILKKGLIIPPPKKTKQTNKENTAKSMCSLVLWLINNFIKWELTVKPLLRTTDYSPPWGKENKNRGRGVCRADDVYGL